MTTALLTFAVLVAMTTLLTTWVRRDRLAVAGRPEPATLPAHRIRRGSRPTTADDGGGPRSTPSPSTAALRLRYP